MTNANLDAALSTPDDDVAVPIRTQPGSFLSRFKALQPGDLLSHVERADIWMRLGELEDKGSEVREKLRAKMASATRAATAVTGYSYSTEITTVITNGGKLYFLAIVTCMEKV